MQTVRASEDGLQLHSKGNTPHRSRNSRTGSAEDKEWWGDAITIDGLNNQLHTAAKREVMHANRWRAGQRIPGYSVTHPHVSALCGTSLLRSAWWG